jgi:hypothetical protein
MFLAQQQQQAQQAQQELQMRQLNMQLQQEQAMAARQQARQKMEFERAAKNVEMAEKYGKQLRYEEGKLGGPGKYVVDDLGTPGEEDRKKQEKEQEKKRRASMFLAEAGEWAISNRDQSLAYIMSDMPDTELRRVAKEKAEEVKFEKELEPALASTISLMWPEFRDFEIMGLDDTEQLGILAELKTAAMRSRADPSTRRRLVKDARDRRCEVRALDILDQARAGDGSVSPRAVAWARGIVKKAGVADPADLVDRIMFNQIFGGTYKKISKIEETISVIDQELTQNWAQNPKSIRRKQLEEQKRVLLEQADRYRKDMGESFDRMKAAREEGTSFASKELGGRTTEPPPAEIPKTPLQKKAEESASKLLQLKQSDPKKYNKALQALNQAQNDYSAAVLDALDEGERADGEETTPDQTPLATGKTSQASPAARKKTATEKVFGGNQYVGLADGDRLDITGGKNAAEPAPTEPTSENTGIPLPPPPPQGGEPTPTEYTTSTDSKDPFKQSNEEAAKISAMPQEEREKAVASLRKIAQGVGAAAKWAKEIISRVVPGLRDNKSEAGGYESTLVGPEQYKQLSEDEQKAVVEKLMDLANGAGDAADKARTALSDILASMGDWSRASTERNVGLDNLKPASGARPPSKRIWRGPSHTLTKKRRGSGSDENYFMWSDTSSPPEKIAKEISEMPEAKKARTMKELKQEARGIGEMAEVAKKILRYILAMTGSSKKDGGGSLGGLLKDPVKTISGFRPYGL